MASSEVVSMARAKRQEAPDGEQLIIPGLPFDMALCILVRLPCSSHGTLRRVSRAWRAAFNQTSAFTALRNSLCVSEVFLFFSFDHNRTFQVYHPLLLRLSSPLPFPAPRLSRILGTIHTMHMLGASGSYVCFQETLAPHRHHCKLEAYIHCLDVASMTWHSDPLPLPPWFTPTVDFSSTISDGCVYIAGGFLLPRPSAQHKKSVHMLDLRTMTWRRPPDLNKRRINPAAVALQGRVCVIGDKRNHNAFSGEIWNPQSGGNEWTLVPELWPIDIFQKEYRNGPKVAVVMDTLYTIRTHQCISSSERPHELELMCYESASRRWTFRGLLPSFSTPHCTGPYHCDQLLGIGQELWVLVGRFCDGMLRHTIREAKQFPCILLSCIPLGHQPLSWRMMPISFKNHVMPKSCVAVQV